MRVWTVVLLVDLALLLGVAWGWAAWGRHASALGRELATARADAQRLERELAAQRSVKPAASGEQQWDVRGVVRATLPQQDLIVLTHEDIPGYMPSMTMAFLVASPKIAESVQVGDAVRFTLRGTPPSVVVTAISKRSGGTGP